MEAPESPGSGRGIREYWALGILVGGALFVRWLFLGCRLVLVGDELHYAESLFRFMHGRILDGFSDYWSFFYPFAAIPFGLVARDAETGLRVLSLLAGAALVIPAYLVARRLWGIRAALFAAVLIALHPNLVLFSTAAFTESLFALLLILALYVFIRGASGESSGMFAWMGLMLGLAYVTRQEAGFVAAIIFIIVLLGRGAPGLAMPLAPRVRRAVLVAVFFLVAVAPYIVLLHAKTGRWTSGSKAAVNLGSAAIWRDDLEREKYVYSLDEQGIARRIDAQARESAVTTLWRERGTIAGRYFQSMSAGFGLVPLLFSTPVLLVLVPLGIFGRRLRARDRGAESLLIILGIFPFLLYALFRPELRYLVPYLPIYLLWGGAGCDVLAGWIRENVSPRAIVVWSVLVVVFASLIPYDFERYRSIASAQPVEWKTIGRWIRDNGGAGARIMTEPGCSVSYYAGDPEATFIPWTDTPGLIRFARLHHFDYILVDDRYIRDMRPTLRELLDNPPTRDLEEVRRFDGPRHLEYILYRVKPAV